MDFFETMLTKARKLHKRLVLTEGTDPETLKVTRVIMNEHLASSITILGKEEEIQKLASDEKIDISDMQIINPELSPKLDSYAHEYYELRKESGMTEEQAKIEIVNYVRWGAMMARLDEIDAIVAGKNDSAMDVHSAGINIVGTMPNVKTVSSSAVVISPDSSWGAEGAFIFSDCSTVPNPSSEQLSDIALCAAQSCRDFLDAEPVVALLSHSTKGSKREDKDIEKIRTALDMIKSKEPTLIVDGEMQVVVALVPSITDFRIPDSPIRGKVNTLVFPNMDAGNIAYQIARLFGRAEVFGPFLQGFAKPISYIPRGAPFNSVLITFAATLARAR